VPPGRDSAGFARVVPWHADALEVVIAEGDIKLSHLAHRAECSLTVFELSPPFMGIETRGAPQEIVAFRT
jgi:hypothetical protein